jgi:hypothetical protein
MTATRLAALSATLAVVAASLVPAPAIALDIQEVAATWSARNRAFVAVSRSPTITSDNILPRQLAACKGLLGEHLRIGGLAPHWATGAQHDFCRAMEGFNGKAAVRNPCGELKKAEGKYAKAKPFGDSDAVMESSREMLALINLIRTSARQGGFRKC